MQTPGKSDSGQIFARMIKSLVFEIRGYFDYSQNHTSTMKILIVLLVHISEIYLKIRSKFHIVNNGILCLHSCLPNRLLHQISCNLYTLCHANYTGQDSFK